MTVADIEALVERAWWARTERFADSSDMLLLNAKSRAARAPRVLGPARRHARVPQPRRPLAFADCEHLEPLALGRRSGRRPSALTRGRRTPASAGGSNRPTSPT